MDIVTDQEVLSRPCRPCRSLEEGRKIGQKLIKILEERGDAVGIAANQVGIDSRVCVIKTGEKPLVLINPRIIGKFKKIFFDESCLSFPGCYIITERYENIAVADDNHDRTLIFGKEDILRSVCVQHEIDHLDGITMFDRQIKEKLNAS